MLQANTPRIPCIMHLASETTCDIRRTTNCYLRRDCETLPRHEVTGRFGVIDTLKNLFMSGKQSVHAYTDTEPHDPTAGRKASYYNDHILIRQRGWQATKGILRGLVDVASLNFRF